MAGYEILSVIYVEIFAMYLDLAPGTLNALNHTEAVNRIIAHSELHPAYPANTTVTAGPNKPIKLLIFLIVTVLSQPLKF